MPGRWHVALAAGKGGLRLIGIARCVEPPVQYAICEAPERLLMPELLWCPRKRLSDPPRWALIYPFLLL